MRGGAGDAEAPRDGARRERVEQEAAQLPSVDLRPEVALGRFVLDQRGRGVVDLALLLALEPGERAPLVVEAGGADRLLAAVGVQVDRAALLAGVRGASPARRR
ncbi:hypothetical protein ACVDFE_06835 [Lentzea chajnantorensis]